jgi:hypothetical protein
MIRTHPRGCRHTGGGCPPPRRGSCTWGGGRPRRPRCTAARGGCGPPVVAPGVRIVPAVVEGVFDAVGGGLEGRYSGAVLKVGGVIIRRSAAIIQEDRLVGPHHRWSLAAAIGPILQVLPPLDPRLRCFLQTQFLGCRTVAQNDGSVNCHILGLLLLRIV